MRIMCGAVFVKEALTARAVQFSTMQWEGPQSLHHLALCTWSKWLELAKPCCAHVSNGEYKSAYLVDCKN